MEQPTLQSIEHELRHWLAQEPKAAGEAATDRLFAELYQELHRLAHGRLRKERPDHTLSATALTHEAYLRLSTQDGARWQNSGHFMAMAAVMMRRILVDHALARQADKRNAELVTLSVAEQQVATPEQPLEVLDLHRALQEFEQLDARAARVVELRYFGGMELEEIAGLLAISLATVKRDWVAAKAWLKSRLAA